MLNAKQTAKQDEQPIMPYRASVVNATQQKSLTSISSVRDIFNNQQDLYHAFVDFKTVFDCLSCRCMGHNKALQQQLQTY